VSERQVLLAILAALVLAAPFPWYLIAVGGVLPLPLIALAVADSLRTGAWLAGLILLLDLALGVWIFSRVARLLTRRICLARPSRRPAATLAVLLLVAIVSALPVYGGGENLASPGGKFTDLYSAYRRSAG
jgi:hypothetical protein